MATSYESPKLPYNAVARKDRHNSKGSGGAKHKRKVFMQYPEDTVQSGLIKRGIKPAGSLARTSNSKWRQGYKCSGPRVSKVHSS